MPLISYLCTCGEVTSKYVRAAKDSAALISCPKCGLEAKKAFGATSSSYKIKIDMPGMARAIEILPDIGEILEERSNTDFSEED
jgi:ABC-type arginine transport system permease subunit